jgi:hypothetical protein
VVIPPGRSGRKRSFKVKLCWNKKGIKSLKKASGKATHGCTSAGKPKRGLKCKSGTTTTKRRKPAKRRAAPKRRRASAKKRSTRRKSTTKRYTFSVTKDFATLSNGKRKKGCRKVKGRYRCGYKGYRGGYR